MQNVIQRKHNISDVILHMRTYITILTNGTGFILTSDQNGPAYINHHK